MTFIFQVVFKEGHDASTLGDALGKNGLQDTVQSKNSAYLYFCDVQQIPIELNHRTEVNEISN